MTYLIKGLDPVHFRHLFGRSDADLAENGAVRMKVDAQPSYPCRVSLTDREIGETVLLVNHVSHEGNGPYRASHAIFVTEVEQKAAEYLDSIPPALDCRILSLRAFDSKGMMTDAALADPGAADSLVRKLLDHPEVDHIDAHNAIRGCFAARIDRAV